MKESTKEKRSYIAKQPPMGWNSWDCYGASVCEEELLGNARYMAENLRKFGWEYVVCDIQWYEPTADSSWYHKFAKLEMDEYSRLVPATNRFPSAADGKGFKPIADQIHEMGLKFGIHIMRGIPRQAVFMNTAIKGTSVRAKDIAHPSSVCAWNTDMYGLDPNVDGSQAYYDSLFELYAQWGVDYVKVDDIAATRYTPQAPGAVAGEIDMIRRAIDKCGRSMVLSLSPGPAKIEEKEFLLKYANMWRMTDDLWDDYKDLFDMFERCHVWTGVGRKEHWPDCDMIPLGHISIRGQERNLGERYTRFTQDEQKMLMTLWCIFRSPLMFGGEMRDNDAFTYGLMTNEKLLAMHRDGRGAHQVYRKKGMILWTSRTKMGKVYVAVFNVGEEAGKAKIRFEDLGIKGKEYQACDIWNDSCVTIADGEKIKIAGHSCVCLGIDTL